MRIILRLFLLFTVIFSFSCEKQGYTDLCPDCTSEEPKETDIELKVDLDKSKYGESIIVKIYEGNLEDSVLFRSIYYNYNSSYLASQFTATINKKYTLTATYYIGSNVYITVDSATPRVRYTRYQCDNPCYFVYDRIVDLRLKYTK
jgi:hypothetical protein